MNLQKKIEEQEDNLSYSIDTESVPPTDIVAYNELRSCADLFRMFNSGQLDINPAFQRELVWPLPSQTRFIDSLSKQLPIPSLCFAYDYPKEKWIVIDGLQRTNTLIHFLSDRDYKLSKLEDISPELSNRTNRELRDPESSGHKLYVRIQNVTLPVTVLRCDTSKKAHNDYLFTIFHRLNTGGMRLNNQEIRNCIYNGPFNDLLQELDQNPKWRRINRMKKGSAHRFSKQEIILRVFAFLDNVASYKGKLSRFLNDYMEKNKNLPPRKISEKKRIFERTLDIIHDSVLPARGTLPKINIATLEALFVGIASNISNAENATPDRLKKKYKELLSHESFSETSLSEGLAGKEKVTSRLAAAKTIFQGV